MTIRNTYHRDGTITYWSVYEQRWIRRATHVPARELAAMSESERARVLRAQNKRDGSKPSQSSRYDRRS